MIECGIYYNEDGSARIEQNPSKNHNFDYWLAKKIPWERWRMKNDKAITMVVEVTAEEAKYVEMLLKACKETGDKIDYKVHRAIVEEISREKAPEPELEPAPMPIAYELQWSDETLELF